jgi:hypothetical protein
MSFKTLARGKERSGTTHKFRACRGLSLAPVVPASPTMNIERASKTRSARLKASGADVE